MGAKEYEWVDDMEFGRPLPWAEVTECRQFGGCHRVQTVAVGRCYGVQAGECYGV